MGDKAGAKEKILETVIALLAEGKDASKVSNRDIAAAAGVNSALINYYYQSKENLIALAADACMARIGGSLLDPADSAAPIDRIRAMLKQFCAFCMNNTALAEIAVKAELKAGSQYTSRLLFPLFREHFGKNKSDLEIKLMTMQLLNPIQLLFLSRSTCMDYLGMDAHSPDTWNILIEMLLNNLVNDQ